MFDIVVCRIDHARYQDLTVWQLDILEDRPFVLVTRIRALVGKSARAGLENNIKDISNRYIAMMRAFVISPAQVDANAIFGDSGERVVERFDVHFQVLAELGNS